MLLYRVRTNGLLIMTLMTYYKLALEYLADNFNFDYSCAYKLLFSDNLYDVLGLQPSFTLQNYTFKPVVTPRPIIRFRKILDQLLSEYQDRLLLRWSYMS